MRNHFKNIVIVLLVCVMLCLCGCSSTPDGASYVTDTADVVSDALSSITENASKIEIESSEIENVSSKTESEQTESVKNPDSEKNPDPQDTEVGREKGEKVEFQKTEPQKARANGIDVSKWQGRIDWKKVKSAGIDFAIIRIGYRGENGKIFRDDNADYNIQQAQKAGLLVGVYFFSTATNEKEAREEAAWTLGAIKGYKISYPVVYDCEGFIDTDSRMFGISSAERTNNAVAFLKAVKKAGYTAMIYGSKTDFENGYWELERIQNDYKVWVAHYSQVVYPQKQTPDYSGKYDMWQYTNRGTVSGVEGDCDMIVSYFKPKEATEKDRDATPDDAEAPKTEEEKLYTDANDEVTAKDEVNLRAGAGTSYDIVATLKSGEFVKRTGIGKNGWSRLKYKGKTVYAITSYLSNEVVETEKQDIVNGSVFTPANDKVTAKSEVNLRKAPTTDSEIVATIKSGTFLSRTAIGDRGWSRLEYKGKTVYAVTSYLTTEAPESKPEQIQSEIDAVTEHGMTFTNVTLNVTAKEEVNLRDKPTTDGSNVVHTLKNGEYITKTGVSDSGWARLEWNGQIVYAIDSFLTE